MNKEIMKEMGFEEEVKKVEGGKCPFCHKTIDMGEFRGTIDIKEYIISGLCQSCIDKTFGGGE